MKRRNSIFVMYIVALSLLFSYENKFSLSNSSGGGKINLSQSPELTEISGGYTRLTKMGDGHTTEAGMPELPQFTTYYQLDPSKTYEFQFEVLESYTIEDIIIELTESGKANFCYSTSNDYDDVFHIGLGEVLCKADPRLVYCGLFEEGEKIRVIVYAGDEISKEKSAGEIVRSISQILGGAGGGSSKFAQGGGTDKSKKEDAIKNAKSMIIE